MILGDFAARRKTRTEGGESFTHHALCPSPMWLSDFIEQEKQIEAHSLIEMGAIYVGGKRTRFNCRLTPGDYVRIHYFPRRFSISHIDWDNQVVADTPSHLVINKPVGVPVPPTLDNAIENVGFQVSRWFSRPFWITHRLDMGTSGLLVLAKTREFQTTFNRHLSQGKTQKRYLALSKHQPPLGFHQHHMISSLSAPKQLLDVAEAGTKLCSLKIEEVAEHRLGFLSHIELITGRTHQIRAQFQALGCPLINDALYGGEANPVFDPGMPLHSSYLKFLSFEYTSLPHWVE